MAVRPELVEVYEYVRWQPEWVTRRQVAEALDISVGAARYRLWKLAQLGWIQEFTAFPPRRIFYGVKPVKPPPPPPPPPVDEELVGDEETTGWTIYYHTKRLKYMIRDPEVYEELRDELRALEEKQQQRLVAGLPFDPVLQARLSTVRKQIEDAQRIEDSLLIETTASLATDVGHDVPVNLEITAITTVSEMSASVIFRITRDDGPIEKALMRWMRDDLKFGALARHVDTIDHAFMGESQERLRGYPCSAPEYPTLGAFVERRSRFVGFRKYPKTGCDHIQAE